MFMVRTKKFGYSEKSKDFGKITNLFLGVTVETHAFKKN